MKLANEQSVLDAIPCSLFKQLFPVLLSSLNIIINDLSRRVFFLTVIKMAIVIPILKAKRLDSAIFNNYRPVSNVTALSKVSEKCILKQLSEHLQRNGLYASYQSAYRPFHSY